MLDERIPAIFDVHSPTVPLCQALTGKGRVLELPAIEIPALEVRTVAGVDHHRNVPDKTRGV
ncbi:MAG TPA: hypothetical protein VHY82_08840, partial [Acetobacteraceae bacterium]|nr:hypothetical protein [Acetobacteraceae bacterium]